MDDYITKYNSFLNKNKRRRTICGDLNRKQLRIPESPNGPVQSQANTTTTLNVDVSERLSKPNNELVYFLPELEHFAGSVPEIITFEHSFQNSCDSFMKFAFNESK